MLNRNKGLFTVITLVLFGLSGYTQNNNTTSPYSRFGLGDLQHYGFGRTAAMGGASLGSRHEVQINSANPASYNSTDSLSFIFEFGADAKSSQYKSTAGSAKASDVNFTYFSLGWPVTKWMGMAMGIQPFSDMGYDVEYSENMRGIGEVFHNYQGEGTTSKAFLGVAVSPFKHLSVGANLNYIFGRLSQNTTVTFDRADLFYFYQTEGSRLRDFRMTYGLQYDIPLKKDQSLTIGATFENNSDIAALHRLFSYKAITINSNSLADTLEYVSEVKDIIKLPSSYGIGLSYKKINKLEVNFDYYHTAWSQATFYGDKDEMLTDQNRISAGVEYVPDALSIRSYFKRVKYRAGLHQDYSYLKVNNKQIKEFGISFGAGLPLPKSRSTANLALEFGKRGTTNYDLVKENYLKFSLYLNFYDYWFVKRKFD